MSFLKVLDLITICVGTVLMGKYAIELNPEMFLASMTATGVWSISCVMPKKEK